MLEVAYTLRLKDCHPSWLVRVRVRVSSKRFGEVIWGSCALGFNETCLGFVFSHGSGALKSFRLSLPQTLVMYSPGKGSGKFPESACGNMEAGMAGQATGSCQGQQRTGSGSNTLDPWGDSKDNSLFSKL